MSRIIGVIGRGLFTKKQDNKHKFSSLFFMINISDCAVSVFRLSTQCPYTKRGRDVKKHYVIATGTFERENIFMPVYVININKNKNDFKANQQFMALPTESFLDAGKIVCSQTPDGKLQRG
jgi:hypothetical protein